MRSNKDQHQQAHESTTSLENNNNHGSTTTTEFKPTHEAVKKTSVTRYVLYFIVYSVIFWVVYCVYLYKTDAAFKQSFVRWYLKTFHHKKSETITEASLIPPASHCVDFATYGAKLPFKKSGGKSSTDYFVFTEEDLAHYNGVGENKKLPLLLAIAGRVYDVSEGKDYYGPGGGYSFFSGRDGTRSFVTGCFDEKKEECTSEQSKYSDFTEEKLQSIKDWIKFYDEHEKYKFVGFVEVKNK
ncbi:hypothetical protein C9374_013794 [Naegleria lovaniensis]|uniref:Cytochrome b5 heme-binding domain-containing protein n=1 Tax=Naegleria lovaniensis TaxID=51637 RepID=A0AA88G5S6_NAELO|nr:uncharacterized protein C9374_013794 [Naegleria lovaniensis]KAG2370838.1 hypothetical protein C9374_013794 [Naegleria lovaniensis]